jgi:hypothetical protein
MSEKPDVRDACVSHLRAKKFLMSALAEFGGKFVRQIAAVNQMEAAPPRKRDGLGFPDL